MVLLGGGGGAVEALLGRYPRLPAARLLHLTLDAFLDRYDALYRSSGCCPSVLLSSVLQALSLVRCRFQRHQTAALARDQ